MTGPTDGNQRDGPDVSDASAASDAAATRRPVLARPHPNETVEEFSARFLAEILDAQRSQEQSGPDGG